MDLLGMLRRVARRQLGSAFFMLVAIWLSSNQYLMAQVGESAADQSYLENQAFRLMDAPNTDAAILLAQGTDNINPQTTGNEAFFLPDRRPGDGVDGRNDRLIDRVVDPISWLMQYRFREDWNWPLGDSGLDAEQFQFRPTVPFLAWDQVNLLRVEVPYNIQGSSSPGLDKVTVFDVLVFEPDWGRWGIGPGFRFDPRANTGEDSFQMGPEFGAVEKSKHWTVGFICQNYLSDNNSESQIQPILAYKFNEKLALAIGDMQFMYNWNTQKWTQLPLGIELDYIADLWGQKVQFFANPQFNFERTSSNSGWTIFVGLTLLVPGA
jgi:hypothetical protein